VSGPLAGSLVVDLTRYGPGPYCSMLLGDLGCEVVVVDDYRAPAAAHARTKAMIGPGAPLGSQGSWMRRNARRIALDLKNPGGREVLDRLLDRADVLLEGFRPGVAPRLGIDVASLRSAHRRLVICSITGFGQDGPYRDRAGHDLNYLAMGGLLDGNRGHDGEPVLPPTVLADLAAGGMQAAIGVLAALLARERSGEGQSIDVSLHEGVVALMAPLLLRLLGDDSRSWTLLRGEAPWYRSYATADARHLAIAAVEPWFYAAVCSVLGHPEWLAKQFDTASWPAMGHVMGAQLATRTAAEWMALFGERDSCVCVVPTMDELLADQHLRARGTFVEVEGDGSRAPHVRALPRFSDTPADIRRGQMPWNFDCGSLLDELGFGPEARERLYSEGGVARPATAPAASSP